MRRLAAYRRLVRATLWSLTACVAPSAVSAQIPALPAAGDWFGAISVGQMGYPPTFYGEYSMISAHWMQLRQNRPGLEFALSAFPQGIASEGPFVGSFRGGMTLPLAVNSRAAISPMAGLRLLFGNPAYEGDATALSFGVHAGVSLLAGDVGPMRLRVGVSREQFIWTDGAFWLLEIGAVRRRPMYRGR